VLQRAGYEDVFVWTEVFNCGELASVAIPSYLAHHALPIHVFGYPGDLEGFREHDQVVPVPVSDVTPSAIQLDIGIRESELRSGYDVGHLGTARLFAKIMTARREKYLLHFDSDIIFIGEALAYVLRALEAGHVIAGLRRPYKFNAHGRGDVELLPDCIDTVCMGLNRLALPRWRHRKLVRKVVGRGTQLDRFFGRRSIDFFDPVTQSLLKRGPVAYLDSPEAGPSAQQDRESEFFQSFIQVWSAVGTGCALSKAPTARIPESYARTALRNFNLYAHFLLNREYQGTFPEPGEVESKLARLDKNSWTLT